MNITVNLIGMINDSKFTTSGGGTIDPKSGVAELELAYSSCPPGWSIMNYSDPLVLLAGYQEIDGGRNFSTLGRDGFSAETTIDFGRGMALRKTATIRVTENGLDAVYAIFGTAQIGTISQVMPYQEHLHPAGPGQLMGIGLAKWMSSDGAVDALVSARYRFDREDDVLESAMVRGFEVEPSVSDDGLVYRGKYRTYIQPS